MQLTTLACAAPRSGVQVHFDAERQRGWLAEPPPGPVRLPFWSGTSETYGMEDEVASGLLALEPGQPLRLRLFLDGSALEIFTSARPRPNLGWLGWGGWGGWAGCISQSRRRMLQKPALPLRLAAASQRAPGPAPQAPARR